jgi:RNA polymerase sigma factor (sigma-70 family)
VDAREQARLVHEYTPLVRKIVRIYAHAGFGRWIRDELIQDGLIGLFKATIYFDESRSNDFGAYARSWVTKYVRRGIARAIRDRRERTWGDGLSELSVDPVTTAIADEVWRVIDTLEPVEQRVVVASFGLIKNGPRSYAAIAAVEDLTVSQVRTILEDAKRKIRIRLRL